MTRYGMQPQPVCKLLVDFCIVTFAFQARVADHLAVGLVNCDISALAVKALAFTTFLAIEKVIRP